MKTFSIDELYDYQFMDETAPYGEEYSNFLGFLKNVFPAHTVLGKIMGSTNHSKGIELGDLFKKKKSKPHHAVSVSHSAPVAKAPSPPAKKDNTKKYMMIGGGVLLLIIIIVMIVIMRKK